MISLEQVRQLDIRVKKAVSTIRSLKKENESLKKQKSELEADLENLQKEASTRIADERQLEISLQGVLDTLDEVDEESSNIEREPVKPKSVEETKPGELLSFTDPGTDTSDSPTAEESVESSAESSSKKSDEQTGDDVTNKKDKKKTDDSVESDKVKNDSPAKSSKSNEDDQFQSEFEIF